MSLHHSRQLFQVLQVPLLNTAEVIPFPNTIPFSFQEVEVVDIIFKTMDDFYELFSRYIKHAIIVTSIGKYIKDDVTNIPALTPICNFQIIALLPTPLIVVKAKRTVG